MSVVKMGRREGPLRVQPISVGGNRPSGGNPESRWGATAHKGLSRDRRPVGLRE